MSDTPLFSIPSGDFNVFANQIPGWPYFNSGASDTYRWTAFNLIWKFETLIGVASIDPHRLEKDINNNIFARARGQWTFNGSGTNNNGNWVAAGAGVTIGTLEEEHDRRRIVWFVGPGVSVFNDLLFMQGTFTNNINGQVGIDLEFGRNRIFPQQ